jgi:hypothetical protein
MAAMKTQEQLWAEYARLQEAEDWDAALKLLDLIEPVSDEEWLRRLAEAPLDDEPVSPADRARLEEVHASLDRAFGQRAG